MSELREEIIKRLQHEEGFGFKNYGAVADDILSAIRSLIEKKVEGIPNPYPEDIFTEPTKKQYVLFHKILQENGLTLDKFSGALGRMIWKGFINQVQDLIKEA